MNKKTTNTHTNQTVALIVAGILLASFMGTMGILTTQQHTQTAFAQSTDPNQVRVVWHTARCSTVASCDNMATETDAALGDTDTPTATGQKETLIFHYGNGQTPQQFQIDAMNDVNAISNTRMGFEFFSVQQIQDNLDELEAANFRIMSYDLEQDASPQAEVDDPPAAFEEAKQAISAYNQANGTQFVLMAAPSYPISDEYASEIAPDVSWYHLQSQRDQGDDTTCASLEGWVDARVQEIEAAKPALEDEISFQLTLTEHPAPGKTIFNTVLDCLKAMELPLTSGADVDGFSLWYGGTHIDNDQWKELYEWYERNVS